MVNALAGRKEWATALLAAMAEKKIDRADVTDNTILRIQAFKDNGTQRAHREGLGPHPADAGGADRS